MLPKRALLHSFEWHDLPVDEITITSDGVTLVVTPHDEALQRYRPMRLTLREPRELRMDVTGTLTARDLSRMEVSSFDILEEGDERLSGLLIFLPGAAGVWEIGFSEAAWELVELDGTALCTCLGSG